MHALAGLPTAGTLISANPVDYVIIALYFVFVLGIGVMARRSVSDSIDFFLSGRSLPAWVTGLAFISANLGAVEIMGMSANGAELGISAVHYFWVGAIPAMLFLGVVMMPFYYGSKVRSVPEFMFRRFGTGAHLVNAISFAFAQLLIAGVNLYLLGSIVHALLGWPLWVALLVAAAIVLSYITLGGLSAAIYNEVLQFFVIVAALLPLTLIGLNRVGGVQGLKDKITEFAATRRRRGRGPLGRAAAQLVAGPGALRLRLTVLVGRRHRVRPRLRAVLRLLDDELRRGPARHGVQLDLGGSQDAHHRVVPQDVRALHRHRAGHDRRCPRQGDRPAQGRWHRRPVARPERASSTTTPCCC